MKKILNTIIFLLIGVTVILFGVQLLTGEETPPPQSQVEASEPFKEELSTLEEKLKSIYTDESEQDVNLKTYKEITPTIKEAIEKLNKEKSLEEATEKFQLLMDEWQVIRDMVYIKENLGERFKDDEIISEKPFPKDFEKRLKSLEKSKPEFYKTYQKLYKKHEEVLETQQAIEEELTHIRSVMLLENGTINSNLLDVELITYRNRLEILGEPELINLIDAELTHREQQQAAWEAQQQEAKRQAEAAERATSEAEAARRAEEAEATRRAEEETREAETKANTDRFAEIPSTNRAPSKAKESTSSEKEEETTDSADSESEGDESSDSSEQEEANADEQ